MCDQEKETHFSGHLNIKDPIYLRKHENIDPLDGSLKKPSSTLMEAITLVSEHCHAEQEDGKQQTRAERRTSLHDLENGDAL